MDATAEREFAFHERDFRKIAELVKVQAGISLSERKRELVYGRLTRRLRVLKFDGFADYCAFLETPDGASECQMMVNAITTNLTAFFREAHHFEFLAKQVLPALARTRVGRNRRLRIWSAGSASGEEAFSAAMTVRQHFGGGAGWDAKILATDIDTQMVDAGKAGRYAAARAASIPIALQRQFVHKDDEHEIVVADELRSMVVFNQLNLFDHWPMKGPFDAIFCRNVAIYFDAEAKRALFDRFADILIPQGWLFIGHSESLFRVSDRFRHLGRTIYRRVS